MKNHAVLWSFTGYTKGDTTAVLRQEVTMNNRIITKTHLDDFGARLMEEERSAATVEKYLRAVGQFAAWLDGAPVSEEAAALWKEHLLRAGCAPPPPSTASSPPWTGSWSSGAGGSAG